MQIGLIGTGLIGGSIGVAARKRLGATVVAFDSGEGVSELAIKHGVADRIANSIEEAVAGADIVFVAVPVGALPVTVSRVLAAAGDDCAVTDVGSTKRSVVAACSDPRFIGGHPLAGMETAGVQHANADLFGSATWYLTPTQQSSGVLYERVHRFITQLGAKPVAIAADAHDRMLAAISHLPHVLANALVDQVATELERDGERLPATGPSFRDATRVAGANSAIWTDIYIANRDAICEQIDATVANLERVKELLSNADSEMITAWNDRSAQQRQRLLEVDLAGGKTHELRVLVQNRPGVLAQLTLELANAGVNIGDMALYPAADMSEGTVALWILGEESAERAKQLIQQLGHGVVSV